MKARLLSIVLLLVFAPTAVLTFLAANALREKEATLQYRLQAAAESAVLNIAGRIRSGLEDDLDLVRERMAACSARGGGVREFNVEAERLGKRRTTLADVYVFMNPWGFVRPPFETNSAMEALTEVLRRAIAGTTPGEPAWFTSQGQFYGFVSLTERRDLYAGFLVSDIAIRRRLQTAIEAVAGPELVLVARGPGIHLGTDLLRGAEDVTVSDSFEGTGGESTGETAFDAALRDRMAADRPLAWVRLSKPLESVRIMAFVPHPEEIMETARVRGRLYLWGIAVLALGIVTGAWLVFRLAAEEIRRMVSRQDFLVGISHDLRTPLASMRVLAESVYLDHVQDPAKRRRFLGTIVSECDRLGLLVERVLFLVRFGQDAVVIRPRLQDGADVVRKAVAAFENMAAAGADGGKGEIRCMVHDGIPPIEVDEAALSQVVTNLLDNAFKYGRPGDGSPPRVEVKVGKVVRRAPFGFRKRSWVRVLISDQGPGMPSGVRRRVFRRFYRAPEARATGMPGSGLGLSLCQYVVRSHGGWIDVGSAVGRGTAFSVYLPVEEKAVRL